MRTTRVSHKPERDRAIHKVMQAIAGHKISDICRQAAKRGTPVSPTTIRNWHTKTRYPQNYTLEAALAGVGKGRAIVDIGDVKAVEISYKNNKERV